MLQSLSKLPRRGLSFLVVSFVFLGMLSLSTPSFADDVSKWKKSLGRKIGSKLVYPKSAIRKRIEGRAVIQVTINPTGEITSYEVLTPSGKEALDKVIEKSVKRFSPLPKPPASMKAKELTFKIALDWVL